MTRDSLVIVTAVRTETRVALDVLRNVRRADASGMRMWHAESGSHRVTVVQAGIGRVQARHALETVPPTHGAVLSVGFAGALVPEGKPGDLSLPTSIIWEEASGLARYAISPTSWCRIDARVAAKNLGATLTGPVLSSPAIVASPDDKRAAHRRSGAVAVEMEAAGLVPVVRERGVDLFVVRAILDAADVSLEDLPADLDSSWSARAALLRRPRTWSSVWTVARHVPRASRSLRAALKVVLEAL